MKVLDQRVQWPADLAMARRSYLSFLLQVVDRLLPAAWPGAAPDPVALIHRHVAGEIVEADLERAVDQWWDYIEANGIGNLTDPPLLMARIALLLLAAGRIGIDEIDESLGWFIEFVRRLGAEPAHLREIAGKHFLFGN
jgi:hypothetical protein